MNEITGIVHSNGDESHSDGNDYYAIKNSWSPKTNCSKYNSDNDDISYTDTDDKSNNNESSSENSTEENLLSDSSSNSISISINNHSKKHTSKSNASNTKPKKKKKTKKDDKREEREEREEEDDDDDDDDDDFGASEENTLIRIKNRSTEYDEECTVKASYMWRVLPRVLNVESAPLEIGTPRQFSVVVESMVFVMMLRITLPPPNEEITFEPRSSNTIVLKSGSKGSSEAFFFDVTMHYLTHVKTSIAVTAYCKTKPNQTKPISQTTNQTN